MRTRALVVLALVGLSACGPRFQAGNFIERTRVVVARAHVDGDPTRAWALPGEHVTVEYLVVSPPAESDPMRVAYLSCHQASMAGANGLAGCVGPTFDAGEAMVPAAVVPALTSAFDVPPDTAPSFSTSILTYLGVCFGGHAPVLDPTVPQVNCDGTPSADHDLFQFPVRVVPDVRVANHNPNIHDDRIYLEDVLWTEPATGVPSAGCASMPPSSALPTVRMGSGECAPHQTCTGGPTSPLVTFGCSPDDREMYPAFDADMRPTVAQEHIDITHYVTHGTMSTNTRIDDTTPTLTVSARWNRPTMHASGANDSRDLLTDDEIAALPSGLLVRLWFVARDGRGGADWVERDLCLVQ